MDLNGYTVPGMEHEEFERIYKLGAAQKLVDDMTVEVEKYTKLLELAKADQIEVVKRNTNYYSEFLFLIPSAKEYLLITSGEQKARKNSDEYKSAKYMFDLLTKKLSEDVFRTPVTIIEIVSYGYESYCSEIKFTIPNNNYSFTFTVPNPEKIHPINFNNCFKGKLAFGYYEPDKDCVHNIEYTSYRVADITNAFNEFINKMEI